MINASTGIISNGTALFALAVIGLIFMVGEVVFFRTPRWQKLGVQIPLSACG